MTFSIGNRTWISTGDDSFSIAGSGGSPNIISELEYKGLDSTVWEVYGELGERSEGFVLATFGYGGIRNGTYRDSDYNGNNKTSLFSLSTGDVDNDKLWYFSIDYAYRIFQRSYKRKRQKASIDLLVGYQHWEEDLTFTNGVQVVPSTGAFSGLNSTYLFTWDSLRVGARGILPIFHRFYLKGKALFIPWTEYEGKGVWNLRTDFRQNPSFKDEADSGFGVQLDAAIVYNIWHDLSVKVGYRYWWMESGSGTATTFLSNGTIVRQPFNEAVNKRHGTVIGVNYIF
ncbi:MAG: hypothetical protein ACE5IH_10105 [Thermodesulfobacteriota bacterium]